MKSSSATGFFIISFAVLTSGNILTSSGTASKAETKSILISTKETQQFCAPIKDIALI